MIEIDRFPTGLPEALPERVYVLHLDDIAAGHGLAAAKPNAWRFYAGTLHGTAVAINVGEPARGKKGRMTSLSHGHYVQKVFKEVQAVEELPQVKRQNYELRRLKIPAVMGAFWLASPADAGDLVVPYSTLIHGFKKMKVYRAGAFLTLLRPYALKRAGAIGRSKPA
jgi:hypothetical protein